MGINKIFAICMLVEDFEESLKFYTKTLGFEINNQGDQFTDFKLGESSLAIFGKEGATAMFPTKYMNSGGGSVIAFQVKNLGDRVEEVRSKGVEIIEGPKETEWGQKVAYFLDPDGNVIELSEE